MTTIGLKLPVCLGLGLSLGSGLGFMGNGIYGKWKLIYNVYYLPKTKNFDCVGRGDLTSLFFSKVAK